MAKYTIGGLDTKALDMQGKPLPMSGGGEWTLKKIFADLCGAFPAKTGLEMIAARMLGDKFLASNGTIILEEDEFKRIKEVCEPTANPSLIRTAMLMSEVWKAINGARSDAPLPAK